MNLSISNQLKSKNNNFNLLRLIAAFAVLISHSYPLATGDGNAEPLKKLIGITLGHISVDIFFITSGFLITASLLRSKSITDYILARLLRIYPALIASTILTAFILGPLVTSIKLPDYFSYATFTYIIKNSLLIFGVQFELPGVFINVPWKNAVNGSLWTLPYELKMYFYLLVIFIAIKKIPAVIPLLSFKNTILTLALLSVLLHIANHIYLHKFDNSIRLFSFFFSGAAFYCFIEKIKLEKKIAVAMLFPPLIFAGHPILFICSYILILPYIVFYFSFKPTGAIRRFHQFGDYSYGIYIYAFPSQQLVMFLLPNSSVFELTLVSSLLTFALAYFSWHLIEKNSLKLKKSHPFKNRVKHEA